VSANERDWERLNAKFGLDKVATELPMCLIVASYNNNIHFRIEQNLNSIFSLNYSNYRVVVVDDRSTDNSNAIYQKYFAFHRIDKERYVYIENSKRATTLPNLYLASMNHCAVDSVTIHIDGDDELIGRNMLKVFNWGYQTKKAGVMYTNFIQRGYGDKLEYGFTKEYTAEEKKKNSYR
jgi:glycosyltransferase involved in cell wall biosynthesis